MNSNQIYDIAVSFAGEQRGYVRETVAACKAKGLRVFFDEDKTNDWWGKNFIQEQRRTYSSQTRFFVPFLSSDYLAKPIPMDEFASAMMTAVKLGDGFATPKFNKERGQAVVDVTDYSSFGRETPDGTYDGFFDLLWGKLVDQIEGSVR